MCTHTHARLAAKKGTVANIIHAIERVFITTLGQVTLSALRYFCVFAVLSVKLSFICFLFLLFAYHDIQVQVYTELTETAAETFWKRLRRLVETRLVIGHRQPRWKLEKPQEYDGRRWLQGAWRTIIRVSEDWMNVDRPETGSLSISSVRSK